MIHGGGARMQRVGHHLCGDRVWCDVRDHGRVLRRYEPEVSEPGDWKPRGQGS